MRAFTAHTGIAAPLDRSNVDTDAIIPKQYLKSIHRAGFGPNLFDDWRYLQPGEPGQDHSRRKTNPDFILNRPPYDRASVLLARENFGCGSSREHAAWALTDFGFRAVLAPSFADIFFNNACKNGLLPVVLPGQLMDLLFRQAAGRPGYALRVDLESQSVSGDGFAPAGFEMDGFRKHCLLNGLDEIGLTLEHAADIRAYEQKRRIDAPWLFQPLTGGEAPAR